MAEKKIYSGNGYKQQNNMDINSSQHQINNKIYFHTVFIFVYFSKISTTFWSLTSMLISGNKKIKERANNLSSLKNKETNL